MSCGCFYTIWISIKGILLSPLYLVLAFILGVPGITIHLRCMATGIYLWLKGRISLKVCYSFIFRPIDSTRYFEFHEVWKRASTLNIKRYLDISSPRFLPIFLSKSTPDATVVLLNPDLIDLRETEQLASGLGLKSRCEFVNSVIGDTALIPESFDLITCLSVLEHIPEDQFAIKTIWSLLSPGGKLILTLPCMSQPLEQYISQNNYGVLKPGTDGYTFWQRYYDSQRIESCLCSIAGVPTHISIYGEKRRGFFFRNACMKRLLGPFYPFWREPYMMATEYESFSSIDELPGEGVVMLEFIKPVQSI